jgi:transposase
MTVLGVGPITASAYQAAIDEPARLKRSRSVVVYAGLAQRRYASGEVDWSGLRRATGATVRSPPAPHVPEGADFNWSTKEATA